MILPKLFSATVVALPCANEMWYHLAIIDFGGRTVRVTTDKPVPLHTRVVLRHTYPLQRYGLSVERWEIAHTLRQGTFLGTTAWPTRRRASTFCKRYLAFVQYRYCQTRRALGALQTQGAIFSARRKDNAHQQKRL